jgi:SSS family solute:Na+ symporter
MYHLGLHIIDWLLIVAYFFLLIYIGKRTSGRITNTTDFYQSGRSLGKGLFAFLNFGNITNADQAIGVNREIYRQGLSGLWFQNLYLLITPFYWFTSVLQKRTRYIANGDIFLHRFESRALAAFYSLYLLLHAILAGASGYILTAKTMKALMIKPASEYTVAEKQSVDEYFEFQELKKKYTENQLKADERPRYQILNEKAKRHQLNSFISYLNVELFYFIYVGVIAIYTTMGGLLAAVITDVFQGILILFLSLILIPFGLIKIGGISGLKASVPDYLLEVFSSNAASEYTWYFVVVMATMYLITLSPNYFMVGGAAKDDASARYGHLIGAFSKRFLYFGWVLTGIIAIGLYRNQVSDPGLIWGVMTRDLLGVGLIGMMIIAILAANMSTIDVLSLNWSAMVTKNIIKPYFPQITEKQQIFIGRIVIFVVLFGSIYFAYTVNDIFEMFKKVLSLGIAAGAPTWLVYFWKRLNAKAVAAAMLVSVMITAILPNTLIFADAIRKNPAFTIATYPQESTITTKAVASDVAESRAAVVGEEITKTIQSQPTPIYFTALIHENPDDLNSPLIGTGVFRVEIYLLSRFTDLFDLDLRKFPGPMVQTLAFLIDIITPFLIMFLVGAFTRSNRRQVLDYFYTCVLTPTVADQAQDQKNVDDALANPQSIRDRQHFPDSNWVIPKLSTEDKVGFLVCWLLVFLIIGLFVLVFT